MVHVGSSAWRAQQARQLLDFALRSVADVGGFGWLDDAGVIDQTKPRELWITCRMTHVAAIGTLLGHPGCRAALDHGVAGLTGVFRDQRDGGWYTALDWAGRPADDTKAAYPHAFVILASASAVAAGVDAARPVLDEALATSSAHFWDADHAMVVEQWDRAFAQLDPYRGVNAVMHTTEAYLAAADVLSGLGDPAADRWRGRALAMLDRVINQQARANRWRIPEHFDTNWRPLLDFNRDRPADPFRPYGATIGHELEWARLCLQAAAAVPGAPNWLTEAAVRLYQRGLGDGWAVDGADGFVYTTDWDGTPVVHQRMHWVVAEAIATSAALAKAGLADTSADLQRWWDYADTYLIDHDLGSWHHELDRHNQPAATVWQGKPDVYHAIQACLLPDLPSTPAIVPALAATAPASLAGPTS